MFVCSLGRLVVPGVLLGMTTHIRWSVDTTEDGRNSFAIADRRALGTLASPLVVTVRLAPEDPRYVDLRRNVLAKLERSLGSVAVRLASGHRSLMSNSDDDAYGEIEYTYGARSATSRSTNTQE